MRSVPTITVLPLLPCSDVLARYSLGMPILLTAASNAIPSTGRFANRNSFGCAPPPSDLVSFSAMPGGCHTHVMAAKAM